MKQPILALIIPVYHEESNIKPLLEKIESFIKIPIKIYFIYDNENDPTVLIINDLINVSKYPVKLIRNNHGTGALNAIKTGFESFSEEACVVIMADGSDDLSTINGMYGLFCQGFHIVCGSRYMRNGKQIGGDWFKKTLSSLAGKSLYWLTKIPTHDVTNSFKLYTREVLNNITFESTGGFEIGMEIVVKAHLKNYAISEVPSIWNDRYDGTSKFKLWAWLPKYIKWYIFLILGSFKANYGEKTHYNLIRPVGS